MVEHKPIDMLNSLDSNVPLRYDLLCQMVGELYMDSWRRIKAVQDDANNMGQQLKSTIDNLRLENSDLKERVKTENNE